MEGWSTLLCHLSLSRVLLTLSSWISPPPILQSPLSGKSVLLPELWSKKRRESFPEYFALPTLQGEAWEAKIPLSCLPWQHQPADGGDCIPSGHPAVIRSERQQLAELHSAQLEMAPDLGYSCPGHLGNLPSLFLLQRQSLDCVP